MLYACCLPADVETLSKRVGDDSTLHVGETSEEGAGLDPTMFKTGDSQD